MTESRRTSRPDSPSGKAPGGSLPPRGSRRPLNTAGRPVSGFGPTAQNGSGTPRDGVAEAARDWARGGPDADAATDWERIREAAGRDAGAGPEPSAGSGAPSLSSLLALIDALRGMVPRELDKQLSTLVREALLTLRALIDWYLERLDDEGPEPRVEDIPID